jgi:mono/diheme cytochrome c family protein
VVGGYVESRIAIASRGPYIDCNVKSSTVSIRARRACLIVSILGAVAGCAREPVRPVSGAATFATHCAACHGSGGDGGGPVAATLNVPVPNLRTLTQRNGAFPREWVASKIDGRDLPPAHGNRAMPVWGNVFDTTGQLFVDAENSDQRIDAVIEYLLARQLPPN